MTSPFRRLLASVLVATAITVSSAAGGWNDVSPDDLVATECAFDPTAAAEVLYKEIIYDLDETGSRVIKHHLRTKIYEKSALDHARRLKLWYHSYYRVTSIHARVIKPDGSFIEIDDDGVVTQRERKGSGRIVKSTTISIPQVEVGDIVEYRYRKMLDEGYYLPKDEIAFQEEWPIRKLYVKLKPYVYRGSGFKWASYGTSQSMVEGKGGFYEIMLENQPGYPEEPYQAPDSDARSWFTFYNVHSLVSGEEFWKIEGKRLYRQMLSKTKADRVVSAKASELARGKTTDEEMLRAFYDFCRRELINSAHGKADRLTQKQRENLNDDWTASKTLSNGYGTPRNINTVFCALARSEGIDARLSRCADRSEYSFTKTLEDVDIALPDTVVAIKDGEGWTFYNPAALYMPFGMLDWIHDDVTALVPDKKELIFAQTQAASPADTTSTFTGDFELAENGDLEGVISFTALGNRGLLLKQVLDDASENEREEGVKGMLTKRWPNAGVEEIRIDNAEDLFEPVRIQCDVTIPNYAESIGKRLILQPNVETRYDVAEFPNPTRKTMINFDYRYREESEISIKLPDGYELEAPSAPKPFKFTNFMEYEPKLALHRNSNKIVYNRTLDFYGRRYMPDVYSAIRQAFDGLLAADHHALTLKKEETGIVETDANSNI